MHAARWLAVKRGKSAWRGHAANRWPMHGAVSGARGWPSASLLLSATCLGVIAGRPAAHAQSFQGRGFESPTDTVSRASGVSSDGSVIVGDGFPNPLSTSQQAFRWTSATGIVPLGFLSNSGTNTSTAVGVSADGSVVVGTDTHIAAVDPFHRFRIPEVQATRWTAGTGLVGLGSLTAAIVSHAYGVNAGGIVV